MKKYVDYKPLYISKAKIIKEEQNKIKGWSRWAVFFIIIFVTSFITSFYTDMLSLLIIICIWSLLLFVESIVFIRMYEGFIKTWEKFEKESNEGWQELENKHNIDWNNHFDEYRLEGALSECGIKELEKNIIKTSIENVQKLVSKRPEDL